jgi:hypothetical protein
MGAAVCGGLLAAALLLGVSVGEVSAEHGKARVKTRVVKSQSKSKVKSKPAVPRGHAYAYGRTSPGSRPVQSRSDFDRDGIPDYRDADDDNDGITDSRDRNDRTPPRARQTGSWRNDLDRDGIVDRRDRDVDNDGYRNENDKHPRDRRRH